MKSRTEILVPLAAIQAVPIAVIAWYRLHRYAWYRYSAIVNCHDCKRVYNILAGDSPTLAHLVARGELAILALYPDESLTSWNKNKGIYPYNWIVARYARDIDREKYNIPAIPSTYLLDKNKKVIYKDAIIEAVESYLRHKYKL